MAEHLVAFRLSLLATYCNDVYGLGSEEPSYCVEPTDAYWFVFPKTYIP